MCGGDFLRYFFVVDVFVVVIFLSLLLLLGRAWFLFIESVGTKKVVHPAVTRLRRARRVTWT